MVLLLALLLAFLAQNLVTPWPLNFVGVCVIIVSIGVWHFAFRRGREFVLTSLKVWLTAALVIGLIILWQLFPPAIAAFAIMLVACVLFVYVTRDDDSISSIQAPTFNLQSLIHISHFTFRVSRSTFHAILLLLIMLASLVVNTYNNEHIQPGLHGDEAESGLEARNLNAGRYHTLIGIGWYDQPLPSFLAQAWGLRLFGDTISGLRTTSAVVGALTLPFVYLLARTLFSPLVGLLTVILMACAHWFIAYAHLGINYNQTTLLEVIALWAFWEGLRQRRWYWFILSGLATGAGLYLYFASRLVPILLGAFAMYLWFSGSPLANRLWQMAARLWRSPQRLWRKVSDFMRRFSRLAWLVARFRQRFSRFTLQLSATLHCLQRIWTGASRFTFHILYSILHAPHSTLSASPPLALRHIAMWLVVTLIVFAPMGNFFLTHLKELNSRANFVFLFNDPVKVKDYTGTTDYPTALFVQINRYAALFNAGADRSGQYGNQAPLLDYFTAVFFVLGFAYALARWREPRFTLLLWWIVLTIFFGGVLTIESPFTPRIVGLMPAPLMLAALALVRVWRALRLANDQLPVAPADISTPQTAARHAPLISRLTHYALRIRPWLMRFSALALLIAIAYNNYWLYFERYLNTIEGWAQREIATTVARYAQTMQADQTLYVLGAPELFVWHGTIKFIAPNLRGDDIFSPDADLPIRNPLTRRASFVVAPSYLLWLEKLQQVYPTGQIKEFRRPWGELWFIIYEVSAEEIELKRQ